MIIPSPDDQQFIANYFATPTRHRPVTALAEALEPRAAQLAKTIRRLQQDDW